MQFISYNVTTVLQLIMRHTSCILYTHILQVAKLMSQQDLRSVS